MVRRAALVLTASRLVAACRGAVCVPNGLYCENSSKISLQTPTPNRTKPALNRSESAENVTKHGGKFVRIGFLWSAYKILGAPVFRNAHTKDVHSPYPSSGLSFLWQEAGMMPTRFKLYEKQARQLELIANTLSKKSAKYAALKRAGWALAFVTMERHTEFEKFLNDQQSRELSPDEEKHLRELGLE
jgi:hypothetical protein